MSNGGLGKHAENARVIFTAAEDFRIACVVLNNTKRKRKDQPAYRTAGPRIVLAAFTAELYLKCILLDAGATVPNKHNLSELFQNIPARMRRLVSINWKLGMETNSVTKDACGRKHHNLDSALTTYGNSFKKWRYRYQQPKNNEKVSHDNLGFYELVIFLSVLRNLIITKHPEWEDDGAHFLSTFRVL